MLQIDPYIREKFATSYPLYAEYCLHIRSDSGQLIPLRFNKAQWRLNLEADEQLEERGFVRVIGDKGRQMGSTSWINGRSYWKTTHNSGYRSFILTHAEQATSNIFDMAKRYHENCPLPFRPSIKASNSKELIFNGLDSGYKVGTAGNKSVGRSSTIQFLHASEAAFYMHAEEHAKGIMQAVPREKGTEIWIESTANGMGNWFHTLWEKAICGDSEFRAVFIPWFWDPKYSIPRPENFDMSKDEKLLKTTYELTDDQIYWRRIKIKDLSVAGSDGTLAFNQEFPCCAEESFVMSGSSPFIKPELVIRAVNNIGIEPFGPLIIGVDPGWDKETSDDTAISWRRGDVILKTQSFKKIDNMGIVGILHEIIVREKPAAVNIDIGGGTGIINRLQELGHRDIVNGISFAQSAIMKHIYSNKRTEMAFTFLEALEMGKVRIPDSKKLHADICAHRIIAPDSAGRPQLESKKEVKKRLGRSPDEFDATILTYALPVSVYEQNRVSTVIVQGTEMQF